MNANIARQQIKRYQKDHNLTNAEMADHLNIGLDYLDGLMRLQYTIPKEVENRIRSLGKGEERPVEEAVLVADDKKMTWYQTAPVNAFFIRRFRKEFGLSPRDMGNLINKDVTTIYHWEGNQETDGSKARPVPRKHHAQIQSVCHSFACNTKPSNGEKQKRRKNLRIGEAQNWDRDELLNNKIYFYGMKADSIYMQRLVFITWHDWKGVAKALNVSTQTVRRYARGDVDIPKNRREDVRNLGKYLFRSGGNLPPEGSNAEENLEEIDLLMDEAYKLKTQVDELSEKPLEATMWPPPSQGIALKEQHPDFAEDPTGEYNQSRKDFSLGLIVGLAGALIAIAAAAGVVFSIFKDV